MIFCRRIRVVSRDEKSDGRAGSATRPSILSLQIDYCAAHVDAIILTEVTWMRWALDEDELPDDDALLGGVLVVPAAPAVVVEPAPPLLDPVELAAASVPVTSTWWPLCCDKSEPSRI